MKIMEMLGCMTQDDLPAKRAMTITTDELLEAISISPFHFLLNPIPKRIELDGSSGDGGPATPPSSDEE